MPFKFYINKFTNQTKYHMEKELSFLTKFDENF